MTYLEIDKIRDKEICLFGAGNIGKTTGYEFVTRYLQLQVAFYCDNNILPNTEVRDGIKVRDIRYLYDNKDRIQVVLTVGKQYQQQIIEQLKEHGIESIVYEGRLSEAQILDSIDVSDDETVKQRYHTIYNDAEYITQIFEREMGYKPDIEHPKTFNEKLQWLKLHDRKPEYTRMVDKYEAKRFVEERIGSGYTIPTLGVWNSFDEINFDNLPNQFVLKCTHDCGSIIIVKNKDEFNKEEARDSLSRALNLNLFWVWREWPYKNVERRIIAEPYIEDDTTHELRDYKFFTFGGKAKAMFVASERGSNAETKFDFFDMNYTHLPFINGHPNADIMPQKPENFMLMIQLAERLSKGIPHVRIDFYEANGKVYIGEFTFFHWSGVVPFKPSSWDEIFGNWLELPIIN